MTSTSDYAKGLKNYKVLVTRTSSRTMDLQVIGSDDESAKEFALKAARNIDFTQAPEGTIEYEAVNPVCLGDVECLPTES